MLEALMKQQQTSHYCKGPHPKKTLKPESGAIEPYLDKGWVWQKKINGRRLQIVILPTGELEFWTRSGTPHTWKVPEEIVKAFQQLYMPTKGWNTIEGEWVKGKVYLFDILVLEGKLLSNLCYTERHKILNKPFIFPFLSVLPYSTSLKEAIKTLKCTDPMIEGVVLKSPYPGLGDHNIVRCRRDYSVFWDLSFT